MDEKISLYRVWIKSKSDPLIMGNNYKSVQEAREEISREMQDNTATHIILIDNDNKIVEKIKGFDLEPFKKSLDKRVPGWAAGILEK